MKALLSSTGKISPAIVCVSQRNRRFPTLLIIGAAVIMCIGLGPSTIWAAEHGGTIASDSTWTAADNPHLIIATVTISPGVTLTIEPGVLVWFENERRFSVYGTLSAVGAEFAPLGSAEWGRLDFYGASSGTFNACTIEGSIGGVNARPDFTGTITISNSYLRNNGWAVNSYGGTIELENSFIHSNGHGIQAYAGTLSLKCNEILNNSYYGIILEGAIPHFGSNEAEWNDIYGNGEGSPGRDLRNGATDIDAPFVYWGTTYETEIQTKIWDNNDDINLGLVNFHPWNVVTHILSPVPESFPNEIASAPRSFGLYQNFPNPFNPRTVIPYDLTEPSPVKLSIYDLAGRLVRVLLAGDLADAGQHEVVWRGKDRNGREVSSGTYFYVLQAGSYIEKRRMVLIR